MRYQALLFPHKSHRIYIDTDFCLRKSEIFFLDKKNPHLGKYGYKLKTPWEVQKLQLVPVDYFVYLSINFHWRNIPKIKIMLHKSNY